MPRLFDAWNTDKSGMLTLQQLRAGIEKDLSSSGDGFSPFGGGLVALAVPGPGGRGGGSATVVTGTKDPGLFMSEHWGMRAFSYKIPNGKYLAKLYFAETYARNYGPGPARLFLQCPGA